MDARGFSLVDFVDVGVECTLRQLLEHGYFHADPCVHCAVPAARALYDACDARCAIAAAQRLWPSNPPGACWPRL